MDDQKEVLRTRIIEYLQYFHLISYKNLKNCKIKKKYYIKVKKCPASCAIRELNNFIIFHFFIIKYSLKINNFFLVFASLS